MWIARYRSYFLMASPSSGPGNRPSDFMRYGCESCVGVFRERKRTREFVYVAPYRIGHPSSTAPGQETKIRTHVIPPCSGIMGAAHGVRIEAELNSRPPPHPDRKRFMVEYHQHGSSPVRIASTKYGCGWCRFLSLLPGWARGARLIYMYRTWKTSTSRVRKAWPVQW